MVDIFELNAGLTFTCRAAGDTGEPVVLLHGCPETSFMWESVMSRLAAEGYRCLAPDQRGYSGGARPADVSAYGHAELGNDVLKIATAAGFGRFHLIAHDWGAGAGWCAIACDADRRIASYAALSIPHYKAFAEGVRDDPEGEHYRKFLASTLASDDPLEARWSANDFAALRAIWKTHGEAASDAYYEVLSQPGALTAILNWYRATNGHMRALDGTSIEFRPVDVPSLLIWGSSDPSVRRGAVDGARRYMQGPYEFVELDAGHWLVQDEPDIVFAHLLRHLKRHPL